MPARPRLRLAQHIVATAAAAGLAATVLAPAASARPPQAPAPAPAASSSSASHGHGHGHGHAAAHRPSVHKTYRITTCQGGAYYCITKKGEQQPTWVVPKTGRKATVLARLLSKPYAWAVVGSPHKTSRAVQLSGRCYRALAWLWR